MHERDEYVNLTTKDKTLSEFDCSYGSVVNGIRRRSSLSFANYAGPGNKLPERTKGKLFKKIHKSLIINITKCLKENDGNENGSEVESMKVWLSLNYYIRNWFPKVDFFKFILKTSEHLILSNTMKTKTSETKQKQNNRKHYFWKSSNRRN